MCFIDFRKSVKDGYCRTSHQALTHTIQHRLAKCFGRESKCQDCGSNSAIWSLAWRQEFLNCDFRIAGNNACPKTAELSQTSIQPDAVPRYAVAKSSVAIARWIVPAPVSEKMKGTQMKGSHALGAV